MSQDIKSFKDTLNLPQTDFPIRANAKIEDPQILERWERDNLCTAATNANESEEKFILHDGPPYANGHIHLGHAYNKILKDIIGKSRRMSGMHVPIKPGWDCHGLPIELKVTKELPGLAPDTLIKECRLYAQKWIEVQKEEFKKLGVIMDWKNPYLTMNYSYEASILRAFGKFVKDGYIEKKLKTVPWCMHDQTVLATAEIEYKDRKDPSIYVQFPLTDQTIKAVVPQLAGKSVAFLVWTTTPWTLPLNRAVLIKPQTTYDIFEIEGGFGVVASALSDKICALKEMQKKVIATIPAESFAGLHLQHPFIDNLTIPVILDHHVSLEDGTAAVHCAPGCGPQDYDVALKNNLEIFSPISVDGRYTAEIQPVELAGMPVTDGQIWVLKKLTEKNRLFYKSNITHSYPHCWRCHNGLIFRATSQWFCNLAQGNLKQRALQAIEEKITFLPKRSVNFLKATIEGRLEWCLSRQRTWGVPIPALLCKGCGQAQTSTELIEFVAQGVQKQGIEYWRCVDVAALPKNKQCTACNGSEFVKECDILDVWFDSGVSHYAVLHEAALGYPADIYLEGVDQHRGWFQSSLLTSMVLEGTPCTRAFLTHGFTVDEAGHKMSKSLGNVRAPQEIVDQVGTDGLRLWVSSIDYEGDAIVSDVLLRNIAEVYRKIRNTCRFLISNLYDYDHNKDRIELENMLFIDRYALERLYELNATVQEQYLANDFTAVFHALTDYCAVELSSFYLDIIKDRLYTAQADGIARRSAQTACWYILDTMTKLMAPILSFTAEHVSDYYQKNKDVSIHLQKFANLEFIAAAVLEKIEAFMPGHLQAQPWKTGALTAMNKINEGALLAQRARQWDMLKDIRSALLKAIERPREQGLIKHSLEARVILYLALQEENKELLDGFLKALRDSGQTVENFFKEFLIVSQVVVASEPTNLEQTEFKGLWAHVEHAQGKKCPRCWQWEETDNADSLCSRCVPIIAKK